MRKSLLVMGVAIAALSSCTQSEVLDVATQGKIRFGNSYIGKPTRAAQIVENETFNSFYVYGQKNSSSSWSPVFDNVNVYKGEATSSGSASWGYDELKNYEEAVYSFAAYSDGGILGKGSGLLPEGVTANFTPETTPNAAKLEIDDYVTTDNKDLVVSFSHKTLTSADPTVDFNFKHALSQVKFTIQSAMGINKVEITEFSVSGFKEGGKLIYTKGGSNDTDAIVWEQVGTAVEDHTTKTIAALDNNIATTESSASGTFVVIPQVHPAKIQVQLTAVLYREGEEPKEVKLSTNIINGTGEKAISFEAGLSYNFIATLDGADFGVITFNPPTVEDWKEEEIGFNPQAGQ